MYASIYSRSCRDAVAFDGFKHGPRALVAMMIAGRSDCAALAAS